MPDFFHLSVDGQQVVTRALNHVESGISDWRPAWEECEQLFYQVETRQFASQGNRGGEAWKPLSEGYKKWKQVHYPGKPILQLTGDLKRDLTGRGGKDGIRELTKESLTLGSAKPYATAHQRRTKRMPARPPIIITSSDLGQLTRRMLTFMKRVGEDAGFLANYRDLTASRPGDPF